MIIIYLINHSTFQLNQPLTMPLLYALCSMRHAPFSNFPPGRRPTWPLRAGGRIPNSAFRLRPILRRAKKRSSGILGQLPECAGSEGISFHGIQNYIDRYPGRQPANRFVEQTQSLFTGNSFSPGFFCPHGRQTV